VKLLNHFYLDASALAKRYIPEPGMSVIGHLFSRVSPQRIIVLHLGIAEVVSVIVRKYNAKTLSPQTIAQALTNLEAEVINQPLMPKLEADADLINAALPLIGKHSINATDGILLRSAIDLAADLRLGGDDLVLVASDQRLLRASRAEGLQIFNPEIQTSADLDLLLA
jgi:uncharacterized protein